MGEKTTNTTTSTMTTTTTTLKDKWNVYIGHYCMNDADLHVFSVASVQNIDDCLDQCELAPGCTAAAFYNFNGVGYGWGNLMSHCYVSSEPHMSTLVNENAIADVAVLA